VEALYCGVRVVATDCPNGPREILKNGEYGRLVPVGDVNELARAIAISIDGNAPPAPRESWQPYDVDNIVGKYMDLLFGCAG
jgi:glycosyltransferase involved in cell wall biosynthesis